MRIYLKQAGFSLLELILVIVLLGVLASGAGLLITTPIQAYSDQVRRTQLVDQADMSLRQIARDIRHALPNSVRFQNIGAGWALEMVNTVGGSRYRDEAGGDYTGDEDALDFTNLDVSFNLLGLLSITAFEASHRLVVYNTASADIYADITDTITPYEGIVTPKISAAAPVFSLTLSVNSPLTSDDEHTIVMDPGFLFTRQSPGQRIFVIDGPISYVCDPSANNTRIDRYTGYDYQNPQVSTNAALSVLNGTRAGAVATQVTKCSISYQAGTGQRGGIVTLGITVSDAGESLSLLHQVHVANVP